MRVTSTSSPGPSTIRPKLAATRLIDSVVPRVKMTSLAFGALRKCRTRSRAYSKASVDRWLRRWDTAVDIGVISLLVRNHGVDDGLRSLGRCSAIEVDEGLAVDFLMKNREVRAQSSDVGDKIRALSCRPLL